MSLFPCLPALLVAAACAQQQQQPQVPPDKQPVTTDSGLKYSVLAEGRKGESPRVGDRVKVHYSGWLTDGTLFDSSVVRGEPATFIVGRVIQGWSEALGLMTPGARFKLTVPPELAYGAEGWPPRIPENATLVFEVELLDFTAMPRFRKGDPDVQKKTDSGLVYEELVRGEGDPPGEADVFELKYAFWNKEGTLLDASERNDQNIKARVEDMRLGFLREAPLLMRPGARYRFEVPAELAFGDEDRGPDLPPGSTTVWELEMLRVLKPLAVPEFRLPEGEDVVRTESGLRYQVVEEGRKEGRSPQSGHEVTVHYAGWLEDGTLFDSSYQRGEPATFVVGSVIEGWNEGLQRMREGAVFLFVIPSELAYGRLGRPPAIPADATLVFRVELKEVGEDEDRD